MKYFDNYCDKIIKESKKEMLLEQDPPKSRASAKTPNQSRKQRAQQARQVQTNVQPQRQQVQPQRQQGQAQGTVNQQPTRTTSTGSRSSGNGSSQPTSSRGSSSSRGGTTSNAGGGMFDTINGALDTYDQAVKVVDRVGNAANNTGNALNKVGNGVVAASSGATDALKGTQTAAAAIPGQAQIAGDIVTQGAKDAVTVAKIGGNAAVDSVNGAIGTAVDKDGKAATNAANTAQSTAKYKAWDKPNYNPWDPADELLRLNYRTQRNIKFYGSKIEILEDDLADPENANDQSMETELAALYDKLDEMYIGYIKQDKKLKNAIKLYTIDPSAEEFKKYSDVQNAYNQN